MNIYLADGGSQLKVVYQQNNDAFQNIRVLQSFYYCNDFSEDIIIPKCKDFMLDSGAFTFMNSKSNINIDWNRYVDDYADFINRNNIDKFFEVDIDSIVGYDKVLKLRKRLERKTNRQCIPVFHKSRGLDEYYKMCNEYSYIALGGFVIKEIRSDEYKFIKFFINEAHKRKTKIHGLGFTRTNLLKSYHFDSVDSSSWISAARYGRIPKFENNKIISLDKPQGKRGKDYKINTLYSFKEWKKFCLYAESHL